RPAEIEKASLIVAMSVRAAERERPGVFHFILVAGGGGSLPKEIRGLLEETRAIELIGEIAKRRKAADAETACFHAGQAVTPVRTGLKIPGQVGREVLQIVERGRISGEEKSLPGSSRKAGIAAHAEAKLV